MRIKETEGWEEGEPLAWAYPVKKTSELGTEGRSLGFQHNSQLHQWGRRKRVVGELLQKVLTFAESSLRTGILYIHQPTSALRKSLNSKIHLILSFPEFKVFKLTQKFLDPGGNMIKKVFIQTPLPCTLEFSFFLGSHLIQRCICGTQCCCLEKTFYIVITKEGMVWASKS